MDRDLSYAVAIGAILLVLTFWMTCAKAALLVFVAIRNLMQPILVVAYDYALLSRNYVLHHILVFAWNRRLFSALDILLPRMRQSPISIQYRILHQKLVIASVVHHFRQTSTLKLDLIERYSISQKDLMLSLEEILNEEYSEVLQWILANRKSEEALNELFRKRNVVQYVRTKQEARRRTANNAPTQFGDGIAPRGMSYGEYMGAIADEYNIHLGPLSTLRPWFAAEQMKVFCDRVSDLERRWFEGTLLMEEYTLEAKRIRDLVDTHLMNDGHTTDLDWIKQRLLNLENLVGGLGGSGRFVMKL